eukprot:Skav228435  [mRNA]  locus=scaffold3558:83575:85666:+ [translate_table: standard]
MAMKYMGAYLMAVLGGKENPTASDIKTILEAGGISYEDDMLKTLCEKMEGKQAHELITSGMGKFAACGGGGGAKEEKKKVEEEEEEEDMEFDLFG